jgi:hypothetical protein
MFFSWTHGFINYFQHFSLDLAWWDFNMLEQVHHSFIDGISYCWYEPSMKKKVTYDFIVCFYDLILYFIFRVV